MAVYSAQNPSPPEDIVDISALPEGHPKGEIVDFTFNLQLVAEWARQQLLNGCEVQVTQEKAAGEVPAHLRGIAF